MSGDRGPQPLAQVLSELIALRGYARRDATAALQNAWSAAAGEAVARQTRAIDIKRGVLQVAVANSPLLSELVGFYRARLVARLKELSPELRIKDVKFRLDGGAGRKAASGS